MLENVYLGLTSTCYKFKTFFFVLGADSTKQISSLSRKDIFRLLKDNLNDSAAIAYEKIENNLSKKLERSFTLSDNAKSDIRKLLHKLQTKWQEVKRTEQKFLERNQEWLNVIMYFDESKEDGSPPQARSDKLHAGRPKQYFAQSSERTKRRRTEDIRSQSSTEELSYATQMNLRIQGNVEAAKIVKDITSSSPSKARKYRTSLESIPEVTLSADEAVSLIIEQKLSRSQYQGLRNISVRKKCILYPSYKLVLKAKCKCYPEKSSISICETSAEVKVQALLDHTTDRLLTTQMDVVQSLPHEQLSNLNLICKWGCDGSSGQSMYKQKFSDDDGSKSDASIFFTSLVPLQLISIDQNTSAKIIVWKNPRPSSPRFCRPIKIEFLHETTEATVKQTDYIKEQADKLMPFTTVIDGKEIIVTYKLALTMIDGKVCNAITATTSTQCCYLCNATSKDFNKIDALLKKEISTDHLTFGLSTLHMWIRLFECCLHVSYKLDIKKWQARTSEDKKATENRKKNIQKGFRQQLGLIVDQPKPGFGSTNDGNTARRFFENTSISAAITGFDEDVIKRFHVILQAISSGHEINVADFQEYTIETARKFVDLYPWFYMPTSVHKLLIHGSTIIQSSLLPIGQMSEDAQESCNKYIKRYREDFARKCSRTKSMEDLFLRLLVASDPYISSLKQLPHKKLKPLFPETIALLTSPTLYAPNYDSTSSISMSSDSSDFPTDNSTDDEV